MLFLGFVGTTLPAEESQIQVLPPTHHWDHFGLAFPHPFQFLFQAVVLTQFLINCKASKLGELGHFFLAYFNALYTLAAHTLVLQLPELSRKCSNKCVLMDSILK